MQPPASSFVPAPTTAQVPSPIATSFVPAVTSVPQTTALPAPTVMYAPPQTRQVAAPQPYYAPQVATTSAAVEADQIFSIMDSNHNGVITRAEFERAMGSMRQ